MYVAYMDSGDRVVHLSINQKNKNVSCYICAQP